MVDVAPCRGPRGERQSRCGRDRQQSDYYEKRLNARDAKVDALYAELRKEQAAHIDTLHRMHEVELQLREAEVRKCHKRGCADRVPPSDY